MKKVDGQSNVVQDNVVRVSVNVHVALTGEGVPSTKDDVNIDVEATLATILKVMIFCALLYVLVLYFSMN